MRVLLVSNPDPGHAFNVLGLAEALVGRGHRALVVSGARHRAAARGLGAEFLPLPDLGPGPQGHDFGRVVWERARELAAPLARLVEPFAPEVVVADLLTRGGGFAAELLGTPWLELWPHHLLDTDVQVPPVGTGRSPSPTWWRRRDDARIRRRQEASFDKGRRAERAARRALGVVDGRQARLLATLPGLEYPRQRWPRDAFVVGPMDWDPPWPALDQPAGDDPLVVVTDSTAARLPRPLAETAVEALRDLPCRTVVTTGRGDVAGSSRVVVGRGPHGPLLDRAAVAVGPGGGGFVGKALRRGVPLVTTPLAGDQFETAARLEHLGAGRRVPPGRLRPGRLRREVLRVLLDERFRERAGDLAATVVRPGPQVAAELVEAAASGPLPSALGPGQPGARPTVA